MHITTYLIVVINNHLLDLFQVVHLFKEKNEQVFITDALPTVQQELQSANAFTVMGLISGMD